MGKTPPVVAGRDSYVQDFAEALYDGPGTHERISIVTGPRGIGKTVLLNEFEEAARQQSWFVISETTTEHFNERIRDTLIRKIREVTPDSTRLSFDSISDQAPPQSLRSVLEECCSLLETIDQKMGKPPIGILITLDELHYAHVRDIIEFGTTMQHMIREDREIAVAMAGIPGAVKPCHFSPTRESYRDGARAAGQRRQCAQGPCPRGGNRMDPGGARTRHRGDRGLSVYDPTRRTACLPQHE
ncbi:ATP-binding protein [Corynebacterium sp. NML 150383]|uniref:ATP-binding protein n=1 Tax=Corynebacterium sp. NML 150383 TaxID=2029400 RepID=UPI0035135F0D